MPARSSPAGDGSLRTTSAPEAAHGLVGEGFAGGPVAGAPAPDFRLPDQHGTPISLQERCETGPVVVVFFPYAHTRVCTGELREIQSALPRFAEHGTSVLAISCDSMFTQRVFAEAEGLTFPLLSDFWPHGRTATAYDVFDGERGCALRGTFVIDTDRVVRWSVVNAIPDARDLSEVFAQL